MTDHDEAATDLWIRRFHPRDETTKFVVCFSHAGGSASYFFPFSREMPSGVEVLAVQYPGRHDRYREPAFESIREFVEPVSAALKPYLHHSVAFFGHSLGALVGFEVARNLEGEGHELTTFFASGRRAPSTWRDESPEGLNDRDFIGEIKKLEGTDPRVFADEDLVRMVLPTLRSDYTAAAKYRCGTDAGLSSPVVAVVGDNDAKCTLSEAHAWSQHAKNTFDMTTLPGGHFYLDDHHETLIGLMTGSLAGCSTADSVLS